jgi:3-deoxy-D-manno-octulosonic-acid transferase
MYLLYSFLLTLVFLACLPYFAYQALVNRKYVANLRERMGRLPEFLRAASDDERRAVLWVHCVSVGETLATVPLLKALHARFPQHRLIVSTTTATGQDVARQQFSNFADVCYFPFDWRFTVRRALDVMRPQAVVLMESELWPNFLRECAARKIPTLVANGRISDRSFERSSRVALLLRPIYGRVTRWLMQSATDAQRATTLGALNVSVSGNLKYDIGNAGQTSKLQATAQQLNAMFALASAPLIVAGSTTEGEDELVLAAFADIRQQAVEQDNILLHNLRLLIAPRHPERFDHVAQLIATTGLRWTRRSQPDVRGAQAEIILLDSIGELAASYQFASAVFVGGSLVPKGGHNILEPALYGKPIIVGPHMFNFREITQEFLRRDALIQLKSSAELAPMWQRLLTDQAFAQQLGANARQAIAENRGATARTVEAIAELVKSEQ